MMQIVLTGLAYVFGVLAAIVLLITVMSAIVRRANKLKREGNALPGIEKNRPAGSDIDRAHAETDPKIIAAITAAIDSFESENGPKKFKLLSFRRIGSD